MEKVRAGRYVSQPTGYRAFIPAALPPRPDIRMDAELTRLLSDADRALGRLDGVATVLPNPDLFVAMYVRQEAVLSSQIEGTQSTLEDVLEFEAKASSRQPPKDVEEVVNYVNAMNYGLRRLGELPLSLRLIREIHKRLLKNVRGMHHTPGEFRRSQNWIGMKECSLEEAEYVPPPPHEMKTALANFEDFMRDEPERPVLILCGLLHAQFETIHPFLDGNGRIGRLLITFLLCQRKVLLRPLLYLSCYFKAHRSQYYDRLMAVRNDGDWEGWLKFFLRGVRQTSEAATRTARDIVSLRDSHRQAIADELGGTPNGLLLLDFLFQQPVLSVGMASKHLGCSYVTAGKIIHDFERLDFLEEITGQQRNRRYCYRSYIDLFEKQVLTVPDENEQDGLRTTENR